MTNKRRERLHELMLGAAVVALAILALAALAHVVWTRTLAREKPAPTQLRFDDGPNPPPVYDGGQR